MSLTPTVRDIAAWLRQRGDVYRLGPHPEGPDSTELSLFSTIATFGTALDVTVAELSVEAFFPADEATKEFLKAAGRA